MFTPKGDRPQWQVIYDHLATLAIGDTVTDHALAELLPDAAVGSLGGAFWRAVRQIEDDNKRTFTRVRSIGYRMVEAAEHEGLARRQHRSAKRRIKSAVRKARSADRSLMDRELRRRMDALELNLSAQHDMVRRLSSRTERLESALKVARREQKTDVAQISGRLDRLTDLLTRHGIAAEEQQSAEADSLDAA